MGCPWSVPGGGLFADCLRTVLALGLTLTVDRTRTRLWTERGLAPVVDWTRTLPVHGHGLSADTAWTLPGRCLDADMDWDVDTIMDTAADLARTYRVHCVSRRRTRKTYLIKG